MLRNNTTRNQAFSMLRICNKGFDLEFEALVSLCSEWTWFQGPLCFDSGSAIVRCSSQPRVGLAERRCTFVADRLASLGFLTKPSPVPLRSWSTVFIFTSCAMLR